ncbi:MAG: hypothetical protein AAF682_20760 [Planctomycetota bacterium]
MPAGLLAGGVTGLAGLAAAGIRDEPIPIDYLFGPGLAPTVIHDTDATGVPRIERLDAVTVRLVNADGNLDFQAHATPVPGVSSLFVVADEPDPIGFLVGLGAGQSSFSIHSGQSVWITAFDWVDVSL